MKLTEQFFTAGALFTTIGLVAGCGTSQDPLSPHATNTSNTNIVKNEKRITVMGGTNSTGANSSTSNGKTTSSRPKSLTSHFIPEGITFVNSETGYISGEIIEKEQSIAGCVYKTMDGGRTWGKLLQNGKDVSHIVAVYGHDLWVDVKNNQNNGIYFSKDEGKTFTRAKINSENVAGIDFTSRNVGWTVFWSKTNLTSTVMKTTDGGKHWMQVHVPNAAPGSKSLSFSDPENGFLLEASQPGAGSQGKALLRTRDGGQTWNVISNVRIGQSGKGNTLGSGGYADGIEVVPLHPLSAYIWESRGPLLYTADGGESWHSSPITKPDVIEARGVSMQTVMDGFVLLQDMIHSDCVLEHTTNGGVSWKVVYKWSYSS